MKKYFLTFAYTGLFFLFNACVTNPVSGRKDFMLMSQEQEIALGKQSDPDIVNEFGLYEDKAMQQFIQEKGKQMAAISHRNNLQYEFKIVDSPIVNAFAVPGGYVYFTRGIMAHFNNEAAFAGVLGHEIGHITARHSAKQYSQSMLAQLGLIGGLIAVPELGQYAEQAQQGLSLLFLKFGRDHERESDKLGAEYSSKIGYDAQQMAGFFQTLDRLSKQSGQEPIPDFLSSHPNPQNRYEAVKEMAADWQKNLNLTNPKVNRDSYLKMIDGIVYGEDPKQGYVENQVFYHPVLKFQYPVPKDWRIQNTPQQVQMAPKNGKAVMGLTLLAGESLQAAAEEMLKKYQLTPVESRKQEVNGLPALVVVADQQPQSQNGQQQQQQQPALRTLTYLIGYGGKIYSLMGISTLKDFDTYTSDFRYTMTNFKELKDPVKLNKKPERIRIKEVRQNGTLAQAFRNHQVKEDKIKELAILNGMELEDRVEKGMLIKVLEK